MFRPALALLALGFGWVEVRAGDPTPKVIAAWPAGPLEVRVAFDRPAPVDLPEKLVGRRIAFGDKIAPDAKFESGALSDPADPSKGSLRITGAKLEEDERLLILATDPHASDTRYALALPTEPKPLDLVYGLDGVELAWDDGAPDASPSFKGWWPAFDAKVAAERLAGSPREPSLRSLLEKPGRLTLSAMVGPPKGKIVAKIRSSSSFEAAVGSESIKSKPAPGGIQAAEVPLESNGEPIYVQLILTTGPGKAFTLETLFDDAQGKPVPASATLPWAPPRPPAIANGAPDPFLYKGGDAKKGAAVFASENAKCANCHKFAGKGAEVGPALDGLVDRAPAWIYRQIAEPSAVIHSEYVPFTVVSKDGRIAVGVVRAEGFDKIKVIDTEAKAVEFAKSEVEELRASTTSIMPVGLTGAVGEQGIRDLIAYLTGGKSK